MPGFTSYMENLKDDNEAVLISVFENFVVDAVGADTVEPESHIDKCIMEFLGTINSSATRLPKTKFGVVMPLRRPALLWYQQRLDLMTKFLEEGIRSMIREKSVNNVTIISSITEVSQQFEDDKIHLTKPSAKVFLEVIITAAEKFFSAPLVDLTEQGEVHDDDDDDEIQGKMKSMEDRLKRLEHSIRVQSDKNIANDLMFARSREETDAISNRSKEDRLVINGLKSSTPLPTDPKQRIESLKTLASGIFETLIPGFTGKILFLMQGKSQAQPIPMVEIKMENAEQAIQIRKAYADMKKRKALGREYDSLFIANCVSLATRVRVDVMKAIARRISNQEDLAYVAGFTSRPMMHIRKAGPPTPNAKPLKSFSYIDSVTRFGHLVDIDDLETAYGRAGRSFNGQLQQNFVVLNERDQIALQSVNRATSTSGATATAGGTRSSGGSWAGARGGARGGNRGQKRTGATLDGSTNKK
jgi:hypothetical protein